MYNSKNKTLQLKVFLFFFIFLAFVPNVHADSEEITSLFIPAASENAEGNTISISKEVPGNQQDVIVNVIPLKTESEEYRKVCLDFLEHSIIAKRARFLPGPQGSFTWIGKLENLKGVVIISVCNNTLFGHIELNGEVYKIEPVRGTNAHRIFKLDPGEASSVDAGGLLPPLDKFPDKTHVAPFIPKGKDDGKTFDILVLYTSGFAEAYPGDELNAQINYLIGVANACYSNSNIDLTARVAKLHEIDYKDGGVIRDALNDLTYGEGVFSDVADLRNQTGADLVTLLRVFKDSNDVCGQAWQMSLLSSSFERWAFSVVQVGRIPYGSGYQYCTDQTLAHEIGHNMGCAHADDYGGVFEYSRGYVFSPYISVMASSGGTRVSHFSNPNVSYTGLVTGADDANNALSINKVKLTISQFRDSNCLGSITVFPGKLILDREEGGEVTATVISEYDYPAEGELVKVRVNAVGKKLISVLPESDITNSDGQVTFTITAKKKAGKIRVTFKAGCLKKSITVKVR